MLDLHRLRILQAVAACGSMSAASRALNYTRAGISKQIALLEREIGAAVIERHARGARLTPAGEALAAHADAILARVAAAEQDVAEVIGARGGRVRLGTFGSAVSTFVADALADFNAHHPDVDIALLTDESDALLAKLRRREIDCAVMFEIDSEPLDVEGLRRRHLLDDSMFVAMPAGDALAVQDEVPLGALRGRRWIQGPDAYCTEVLRRLCRSAGFDPDVPLRPGAYPDAIALVAAGLGVALIPRMGLAWAGEEIAVRPSDPPAPTRQVFAVVLEDGFRSVAVDALMESISDAAARCLSPSSRLAAAA